MAAYVITGRLIGCAVLALAALAGCERPGDAGGGNQRMSWARAALERNERIEIVAADAQNQSFTVREKASGELRVIRADEIVGGPPASTAAIPRTESSQSANSRLSLESPAAPGSPPPQSASAAPHGGTISGARPAAPIPKSGAAANETAGAAEAGGAAAEGEPARGDLASSTPGGRLLASGPGYAIKAASKTVPSGPGFAREKSATTTAPVERRHDPLICQGERLLHIDNRNLEFDGDAVSAEDGCEIHITNSHISAKGVGVAARAANVHIDNSQIEGGEASISASDGAQIYLESSRFKGLSRRLDTSAFHDLGGNIWN